MTSFNLRELGLAQLIHSSNLWTAMSEQGGMRTLSPSVPLALSPLHPQSLASLAFHRLLIQVRWPVFALGRGAKSQFQPSFKFQSLDRKWDLHGTSHSRDCWFRRHGQSLVCTLWQHEGGEGAAGADTKHASQPSDSLMTIFFFWDNWPKC